MFQFCIFQEEKYQLRFWNQYRSPAKLGIAGALYTMKVGTDQIQHSNLKVAYFCETVLYIGT